MWKLYYNIFLYFTEKSFIPLSSTLPDSKFIKLSLQLNGDLTDEEYILAVKHEHNSINIDAKCSTGIFYAVQTLLSLLKRTHRSLISLPNCFIRDKPRFGYRGVHLDVARNFMPKEAVIRLLDVMSMYKLNKFHFHLSDDEGWRLQIPGLPELTEVCRNLLIFSEMCSLHISRLYYSTFK